MNEVLAYLLKSVFCSAMLLCYYWFFLRNKRLHSFNRYYLLATALVSILLPLLHFSLPGIRLPQDTSVYRLLEVANGNTDEKLVATKAVSVFNWQIVLSLFYATGVCFMAAMLTAQLIWLYRLKRKSNISQQMGYLLIQTDNSKAPFSFFNLLFWNNHIDINSEEGKRILKHELVHIRQKHTLDKLWIQTVLVFFWFNPFFWLLQKELSLLHEFIADEGAIENRDTEVFARMLLQEYCGNPFPDIILPFFYSSTKRRLLMLNQSNKPSYAAMRRLMVLPLLGATVFLFSFRSGDVPLAQAKKTIVLALDAGHGGEDNGAIGINGAKEKDLTLKISKRLAQMAEAYNIKVVNLRPEDKYIGLPNRTAEANAVAADLLLSLHLNSNPKQEQAKEGFEIVLEKRNTRYAESRQLASAVASQLSNLQVPTKLIDKGLMVLHAAEMPGILIECGYIDNAKDVERITNNEQLDKLCATILSGLVLYQNSKNK